MTLTDVGTGTQFAQLSDGAGTQATFLFENVPVGTYTVLVTRPRYREGFQRVSVGLGPQSVVVPLFLLGQASGRVIDSLTRDQLTNYEVTIVRLNPDATETVVQRVVVPANAQPNPLTGEIRWETTPNSLTTGIYRVDVTDPPPGYRVLGDQVIDADNPNAPVMQFEIKPTDEDPLKLNDIEADPYPTLKGKIFKPLLTNPTTNEVSFVPIDDNALAVTLSCPGAPNVVARRAQRRGPGGAGPRHLLLRR